MHTFSPGHRKERVDGHGIAAGTLCIWRAPLTAVHLVLVPRAVHIAVAPPLVGNAVAAAAAEFVREALEIGAHFPIFVRSIPTVGQPVAHILQRDALVGGVTFEVAIAVKFVWNWL